MKYATSSTTCGCSLMYKKCFNTLVGCLIKGTNTEL